MAVGEDDRVLRGEAEGEGAEVHRQDAEQRGPTPVARGGRGTGRRHRVEEERREEDEQPEERERGGGAKRPEEDVRGHGGEPDPEPAPEGPSRAPLRGAPETRE